MRCVFLIVGLLTASLDTSAIAQGAVPIPRNAFLKVMDAEFSKMDADKNGQVTGAEAEGFQKAVAVADAGKRNRALFQRLDSDHNGQISPTEFAKIMPPEAINTRPMVAQYDGDKNGQISKIEFRTVKLSRFDGIDSDKDGIASVAEQRAAGLIK